MAILRSPDNRLRLELAVRAKGREAEVGTPAVRVIFDQRTLLNWSPLFAAGVTGAGLHASAQLRAGRNACPTLCSRDLSEKLHGTKGARVSIPQKVGQAFLPAQDGQTPVASKTCASGLWRLADDRIRTMGRCDGPGDVTVIEFIARFVSAQTPTVTAKVAVRCACGGVACQVEPGWGTAFRFPRETQGIVADGAAPAGFSKLPIAQALAQSPAPATCLFAHGKCAVLSRSSASWMLLVGDRPADLPGNVARSLLAYEPPTAVAGPVTVQAAGSAAFNCFVPFVVSPALPDPQPMLWAEPGLDGVTEAHGVALARVREADRNCDEVRWVRGEIGEYLLVARRTGRDWHVAALTAKVRAWTVSLPFLAAGVRYHATWIHDPQPDRPCFVPLPDTMDAASRPLIQLADAGGFTLDLVSLDPPKEA